MTDTTTACPECDSAVVYERANAEPPWICYECDAEFEEAVERESRDHAGLTAGRPDVEAAALDTPDAAFADVEPGDRLDLNKADSNGYQDPLAVIEVLERTVWDVPSGTDWVDAEVVLSEGGGATSPFYRGEIRADGTVDLYRPAGDEPIRDARKHIGRIKTAAPAGEVGMEAKLRLADDGVDMPEGDDSWRRVGGESA